MNLGSPSRPKNIVAARIERSFFFYLGEIAIMVPIEEGPECDMYKALGSGTSCRTFDVGPSFDKAKA